jgi:hypothetical protein
MTVTFYLEKGGTDLNVCNRNARIILDIIDYPVGDDMAGELEPDKIVSGFSVVDLNKRSILARDNHGVEITMEGVRDVPRIFDGGLTIKQLIRYRTTLMQMALIARKTNDRILFA